MHNAYRVGDVINYAYNDRRGIPVVGCIVDTMKDTKYGRYRVVWMVPELTDTSRWYPQSSLIYTGLRILDYGESI